MNDHIKNKPNIFLYSKIRHRLEKLYDDENSNDLIYKVGISIIYFRVLHQCEILIIIIKNIVIESVI